MSPWRQASGSGGREGPVVEASGPRTASPARGQLQAQTVRPSGGGRGHSQLETFPLTEDSHPSLMNVPRHSQSICQFSNPLRLESPHPTCVQPLSSRCRVTFQGACAKWSRCREEQPRPLGPGKCLAHSLVSLLFQLEGSHLTCL